MRLSVCGRWADANKILKEMGVAGGKLYLALTNGDIVSFKQQ